MQQWKQKAEETLKGKTFDTLARSTYENIELYPLYTKKDLDNKIISQFPGYQDFRRGIGTLGYVTNDWKVAQTFSTENPEEMKELMAFSFQKGQSAIAFEVSEKILAEMKKILADFYKTYSFSVNAGGLSGRAVETIVLFSRGKRRKRGSFRLYRDGSDCVHHSL